MVVRLNATAAPKSIRPLTTKTLPNQLKVLSAAIDSGPADARGILVPRGMKAVVTKLEGKASDTVHGKKVSINQSLESLSIGGRGRRVVLEDSRKVFNETLGEWRSEVKSAKTNPPEEYAPQLDWETTRTFSGVSTVGKLVGIRDTWTDYTGGAHPNYYTGISSYDATTGKKVLLSDLLTPAEMRQVTDAVAKKLPTLKNADDDTVTGDVFNMTDLKKTLNENFVVKADAKGKLSLNFAWSSGVHALGDLMANITVAAPTTESFLKKIGVN